MVFWKTKGIKFSKIEVILIIRTNCWQITHKFHSIRHPSSSAFVNGKGQTGLLLSGVFWDYRDKVAMTAKTLRPLSAPFSLHLKS